MEEQVTTQAETQKPVATMTRSELNAEIEAAGGAPKGRIDHARSLVTAIRLKGPQAAQESAKRALERAKAEHGRRTNIKPVPETAEETTTMANATATPQVKDRTRITSRPRKAAKPKAAKTAPKLKVVAKKATNGAPTKSIVAAQYRSQYVRDPKVKTESGAASVSNGDGLARAMGGLTQGDCAKIAKDNSIQDRWNDWGALNPGQMRMNLGNVLRAMLRRGEEVRIQGKRVSL